MTDCKRIKIIVTAEDIEKGTRQEETSCPIALALKRKYPKAEIKVGSAYGYIYIDECRYRHSTRSGQFVDNFDHSLDVEPFNTVIAPITFRKLSLRRSFGRYNV